MTKTMKKQKKAKATISRVIYTGLKGQQTERDITATTAVVGANSTGKTTIRDAIYLATFGFHPELGKTNKATMQLASESTMAVAIEWATGEMIKRAWRTQADGTVTKKEDGSVPENLELSAFTPGEFIKLGAKSRLRYLCSMSSGGTVIEQMKTMEFSERYLGEVMISDSEYPAERLKEIANWLVDGRKGIKQDIARTKGAYQLLLPKVLLKEPRAVALEEVVKADEETGAARQRCREARDKLTEAETRLAKMARALSEDKDKPTSATTKANPSELAHLRARAENDEYVRLRRSELNERLTKEQSLTVGIDDKTGRAIEEAIVTTCEDAEEAWEAAGNTMRSAEFGAQESQRCLDQLIADADELEKILDEAMELKSCPTCGGVGDNWQGEMIARYKTRLSSKEAAMEMANEENAKRMEELAEWIEAERHVHAVYAIRKGLDGQDAIGAIKEQIGELPALMTAVDFERLRALKIAEKAVTRHDDEVTKEQVSEQIGVIQVLTVAVETEEAGMRQAVEAAAALRSAEQESRLYTVQQAKVALYLKEEHELGLLLKEQQLKIKEIEEMQARAVQEVWEPITRIGSSIVATVFGEGTAMQASGDEFGLIGPSQGYRCYDVCSGSEQTVMAAAIAVALAVAKDSPTVIIDELSRLDGQTRARFIAIAANRFGRMVEQVIVMDHNLEGYEAFESTINLNQAAK